MKYYPDLVDNITRAMNERGVTSDDLAPHFNSRITIDKMLRRQRYIDGSMLEKVAVALGMSTDELKAITFS